MSDDAIEVTWRGDFTNDEIHAGGRRAHRAVSEDGRVIPVLAGLLLAGAAFNILTWPTFLRRVARDPRARDADGKPTKFLVVHVVLFAIALTLALAFVLAAIAALTGGW